MSDYGMFNFGKGKKIEALRHVFRPSLSYNINPSFDQYYDSYVDPTANEQVVEYSRFEQSLYGAPGNVRSSSVGMSISNTIEAKVRDRDTTQITPKKTCIIDCFPHCPSPRWSRTEPGGAGRGPAQHERHLSLLRRGSRVVAADLRQYIRRPRPRPRRPGNRPRYALSSTAPIIYTAAM